MQQRQTDIPRMNEVPTCNFCKKPGHLLYIDCRECRAVCNHVHIHSETLWETILESRQQTKNRKPL